MLQMFLSFETESSPHVTDRNYKMGETVNDDTVVKYHHYSGYDEGNVIHPLYDERRVNVQLKNEEYRCRRL